MILVDKILCSVSTKGRYHTTLPLTLLAIINQTRKVDALVVFDDNDDPEDLRLNPTYKRIFEMMDHKGIKWNWVFANKKGQHHNHQMANMSEYEWVWRVDDDLIPDIGCLAMLAYHIDFNVGAIGGSILTPPFSDTQSSTGKIENLDIEPNIQWNLIDKKKQVDHLHCSFLYRAGVVDYNVGLSRVAHREETLFTYGLKKKGLDVIVTSSANSWHFKAPSGGIRSADTPELYASDENKFREVLWILQNHTPVVLDCGMGDHVVFKKVLDKISNPLVFTCYPQIIPGYPISEAYRLFGAVDCYSVYRYMKRHNWFKSLQEAFEGLYNV